MFLDRRQIEVIKNAIEDYKFIKEEIEEKINKDYSMEQIKDYLYRFKDMDVPNYETYDNVCYIDFEYKDINSNVTWESGKGIHVSSCFEIFDKATCEYIVEDFLTIGEYEKLLNTPKEEMLHNIIVDLKWYESNNRQTEYQDCVNRIIQYLKEEY